MRPIDAEELAEGLKLHYKSTDQEYETDRQWAVGYNAGLERALYTIACAKTIIPPPNDPLTLEELREVDEESVWVRNLCTGDYTCRVIASTDNHFTFFTDGGAKENRSYGSYWLAYRRKPEEGGHKRG